METTGARVEPGTGVRGAECLVPDPIFFLDLSGIFAFPLSSDSGPVRDQGVIVRWRLNRNMSNNRKETEHGEMARDGGVIGPRQVVDRTTGIDSELLMRPVLETGNSTDEVLHIDISLALVVLAADRGSNQVRTSPGFSQCTMTCLAFSGCSGPSWDPNPAYYHMRVVRTVRGPGPQRKSGN